MEANDSFATLARLDPSAATGGSALADQTLIARISARDSDALGVLYDRYGALIYTLALRLAADQPEAEALVGEVFSLCWNATELFLEGNLAARLIAVTRQCAHGAQSAAALLAAHRTALEKDWPPDVGHRLAQDDAAALHVQAALAALPADQREAIELAYYAGLPRTELAARLRMPGHAALQALRLGVRTLSAQLQAGADASSASD